jgi:hypothetical protein
MPFCIFNLIEKERVMFLYISNVWTLPFGKIYVLEFMYIIMYNMYYYV